MYYFIVDAETDGLYGTFLSVSAQVYNEKWQKTDEWYGTLQIDKDNLNSEWVKENVYPYLYQTGVCFAAEEALTEAFWAFWMKYQKTGQVLCFADVPHPVESRLFIQCVEKNRVEREFLAPFPFYDLETVLAAAGIETLADREVLLQKNGFWGFRRHYAPDDVRMTAELLKIYWDKRN